MIIFNIWIFFTTAGAVFHVTLPQLTQYDETSSSTTMFGVLRGPHHMWPRPKEKEQCHMVGSRGVIGIWPKREQELTGHKYLRWEKKVGTERETE